jgi:hypothetical protein
MHNRGPKKSDLALVSSSQGAHAAFVAASFSDADMVHFAVAKRRRVHKTFMSG